MVTIPRKSYQSRFRRMFVLTMTSSGSYQNPTVILKHPNDVANLHCLKIDGAPHEVNRRQRDRPESNPLNARSATDDIPRPARSGNSRYRQAD